jgi:tRNA pseudouridine38-40 synthase
MELAHYKVTLAYDGSAFSGMQRQAKSRTVQAVVEEALRTLGWAGKSITAAGRTDAGVHASGQVIAFGLEWAHSAQKLQNALNAALPADVVAKDVREVAADFHPRYDAIARCYDYRIYCQPQREPVRERIAWRVWPAPKLSRLQTAARSLRGEHDFVAFGSPPKKDGSTIRKVLKASWRRVAEDELVFTVEANAFLYHMVRRMVGLQVKVGQGFTEIEMVEHALRSKSNKVRELAPGHGLVLTAVRY